VTIRILGNSQNFTLASLYAAIHQASASGRTQSRVSSFLLGYGKPIQKIVCSFVPAAEVAHRPGHRENALRYWRQAASLVSGSPLAPESFKSRCQTFSAGVTVSLPCEAMILQGNTTSGRAPCALFARGYWVTPIIRTIVSMPAPLSELLDSTLSAIWNVEITHRSICLPDLPRIRRSILLARMV
jgi:hypothetical protein